MEKEGRPRGLKGAGPRAALMQGTPSPSKHLADYGNVRRPWDILDDHVVFVDSAT